MWSLRIQRINAYWLLHVKLKINKISTTVWEKILNYISTVKANDRLKKKGFIISFYRAWENSWHLVIPPLVSPRSKLCLTNICKNCILIKLTTQIWVVLLIGRVTWAICFSQSEASATQIWVVTHHQYGISALISQTLFCGESSYGVVKYQLFSQASCYPPNCK